MFFKAFSVYFLTFCALYAPDTNHENDTLVITAHAENRRLTATIKWTDVLSAAQGDRILSAHMEDFIEEEDGSACVAQNVKIALLSDSCEIEAVMDAIRAFDTKGIFKESWVRKHRPIFSHIFPFKDAHMSHIWRQW